MYSIGIDLGTTNSAVSYAPLDGPGSGSQVFAIPQRASASTEADLSTLPSFLHRPGGDEQASAEWIAGAYARKVAADRPGAVVHSAKSWLGHHAIDRSQPILPWGSREIPTEDKISPVEASAALLRHLRTTWDGRFPDAPFDQQSITVTVPASFDAVAQSLTLEAAKLAGFPASVRLLEEPQAAFYRWLEGHPGDEALNSALPGLADSPKHVVVIDIGGGTSDFSLFEITAGEPGRPPHIKRVAVSDHILLGGDNIDLALAHLVETRLGGGMEAGSLTASQWSFLVAQCRNLKEEVLSKQLDEGQLDTPLTLSIPSAGSGLLAGTLSAEVAPREILDLLLDGFFPTCAATARPSQSTTGLRELGLPYASDSAITKHLAAFLHGRPTIDAVLCNGGTLNPPKLRAHLLDLIGQWQGGKIPAILENPEHDLAVARGAAHYGVLCHEPTRPRIESGAARAVYLEVAGTSDQDRSLVCILPRGTAPEHEITITEPTLTLRLGTRVEFKPWYSTRRSDDEAGTVIPLDPSEFHPLPPLRTTAQLPANTPAPADGRLPVHLLSRLSAVGLLQVACVAADGPSHQRWPLEFDLLAVQQQADAEERQKRKEKQGGLKKLIKIKFGSGAQATASAPESPTPSPIQTSLAPEVPEDAAIDPGVSDEVLAEAQEFIRESLQNMPGPRQSVSVARLTKQLQLILRSPKQDWNGPLVRALWDPVADSFSSRDLSPDHEATWMGLAGFLLRPGYGAPGDAARIDQLWQLHEEGLAFPKKGQLLHTYVLWRRVAGGLERDRQTDILAPHLPALRGEKKAPAELVLLAGSLERLESETKSKLAQAFTQEAAALAAKGGHAAPYFIALTGLLSRTPLYTGPDEALPPEAVAETYDALRDLDWSKDPGGELAQLFLSAARLTGDRQLDIPHPLAKEIAKKLEKAGTSPAKFTPLHEVVPLPQSERSRLFSESLPAGLALG